MAGQMHLIALSSFWGVVHEAVKGPPKMPSDKIDATSFMIYFFENYTKNFNIMKEN